MHKEFIETEIKMTDKQQPGKIAASGPGKRLQAARIAANFSLESVAIALHLTTQMVADLENEHYDKFAGHTFIRGYLRNYARLLHISSDEIIAAFNKLELAESETDKPKLALKTTYRRRSSSLLRWGILMGAILLVVAVSWLGVNFKSAISGLFKNHKPAVSLSQMTQPSDIRSAETEDEEILPHDFTINSEQLVKNIQVSPMVIPQIEQK